MESENALNEMRKNIQLFLDSTKPSNRKRFYFFCKQIGLDSSKLTEDEYKVLMSTIEKSNAYKQRGQMYK